MVRKLFKKAENVIDQTSKNVDNVVKDVKKLMQESETNMNFIAGLAVFGLTLSVISDLISIRVGLKSLKIIKGK